MLLVAAVVLAACGSTASRSKPGDGSGGTASGGTGGGSGNDAGGSASSDGGAPTPHYGGFQASGGTRPGLGMGGEVPASEAGAAGEGGEPSWPELGCDLGTWDHDGDASTPCIAWSACAAGQYVSNAPSLGVDRQCASCADGTFSASANAPSCIAWSVCSATSTQVQAGTATADRVCSCQHNGILTQVTSGRSVCSCPAGTWGADCNLTSLAVSIGWGECVLRSDHRVACWGYGTDDEPPATQFQSISSGAGYVCGIRLDGTLECWGENSFGQATPPSGTFTQVSAGYQHACAIRSDGSAACWGNDEYGAASAPPGTFKSIGAEARMSCGIELDGDVLCWGEAQEGHPTPPSGKFVSVSSGDYGSCALAANGSWKCWGQLASSVGESGTGPAVALVAGFDSMCSLDSKGTATCSGATLPERKYASIDVSGSVGCGITTTGELVCGSDPINGGDYSPLTGRFAHLAATDSGAVCGLRTSGELDCSNQSFTLPPGPFDSIAAGQSGFCGVKRDGTIACLGLSVLPPADRSYRSVALGYRHVVGITTSGELVVRGDSDAGRSVPPPGKFLSASGGFYNSCAVRTDGRVLCWVGVYPERLVPPDDLFETVSVGYDAGIIGHEYACGLRLDGTVRCWGDGVGSLTPPDGTFVSLSTSARYACALSLAGKATCWGTDVPPLPSSDLVLSELVTSYDSTCGLTDDGRIECRGAFQSALQ